jgi:hypothetical protein
MTRSSLRARRGVTIRDRDNRWVSAVTWVALLAPLPYTVSRVLWAAGVPAGIDPELLREFHSPGWGSLYILSLAALAEAPALLIQLLVRPRARFVPGWVPVLGGKPARPSFVTAALAVPLGVLSWRAAMHLTFVFNGFRIPRDITGVPHWSLWSQAALLWIWSASLAATIIAYQRATRAWARPTRPRISTK